MSVALIEPRIAFRVATPHRAVQFEGGLFGPDFVEKLEAAALPGQRPTDFGLPAGRSVLDEAAALYRDARQMWQVFRRRLERLPEGEPGTSETRNAWVIPFLNLLGYDLRYNPRAYVVGDVAYHISHRAGENEDAPPVHIVAVRKELGRVDPTGRPRMSPHALMQEFLNRSEHLWGIVTNGRVLRLLRKSPLLRQQAYVEFDLEAIFEAEGDAHFNDFVVLYRLLHRTRLPQGIADAAECWLERYYQQALEEGNRARDRLRDGVEASLQILGTGFLRRNPELPYRDSDPARALYADLLRLVYRFLFLLVAEERNLLGGTDLYRDHYSITRLRRLADRREAYTDHEDLWLSLRVLWQILRDPTPQANGQPLAALLGLPVLDGGLFEAIALENLRLTNRDLLEAVYRLSYYYDDQAHAWHRVNYAALDVEELGSVYESLLDHHPIIVQEPEGPAFRFAEGTERKSTGSYYTPPELVQELIKSALEPVIEERLEEARRMANGEWRTVRTVWQGMPEELRRRWTRDILSRLPGSGRVATRHDHSEGGLSLDRDVPTRRDVRPGGPDAPSRDLNPGEHRGRLGQTLHRGVPPVPPQGQRQPGGTGNVPDTEHGHWPLSDGAGPTDPGGTAHLGQTAHRAGTEPLTEEEVAALWPKLPFAIRYSLFAQHKLLSIKVVDPACGSGHFLLAAARRLAKELARVRTGEEEPSPEAEREAKREVIAHCIYGVDKNPLAVELCKVALWIEGHVPGKPLTFLDHRIRCGDSLVGVFDLSVLKEGIPDAAYKPVSGDDKRLARDIRKRNAVERTGQLTLFTPPLDEALLQSALAALEVEALPDDSPEAIAEKARRYEALRASQQAIREACDLWTAAFFQRMANGERRMANGVPAITTDAVRAALGGQVVDPRVAGVAQALAHRLRFFHWPLEFPEVFAEGGFDVVLCNPPWERIKLQEREFFATRDPEIANAANKAARQRLIQRLPQRNPTLWREYRQALHDAEALSKFLRGSTRFPYTARGDINTYSVFSELFLQLLKPKGRAGVIVPTGIATDDTNKHFFAHLVDSGCLVSLFDFENREKLFPAVDSRYKFSLLTLRGPQKEDHSPFAIRHSPAQFTFFLTRAHQLRDNRRRFTLTPEDLARINPNTRTLPVFRTRQDAELTKAIYRRVPVLVNEATGENPWGVRFLRMLDMSNDSHLFRTRKQLEAAGYRLVGNRFVKANGERRTANGHHSPLATHYLPLYEAKMIWHYDHRYGTYEGVRSRSSTHLSTPDDAQHADPAFLPQPWYWVPAEEVEARLAEWEHGWLLGFRNVTNTTNERTAVFSLLPRTGAGNSMPLMLLECLPGSLYSCLCANLSAMVFDWVVRQKLAGVNMNFFYVQQFPVLPPDVYTSEDLLFIVPRVLELVYTAWDMKPFADDVWREADEPLRTAIRAQWQANKAEAGSHSWDLPEWIWAYPEIETDPHKGIPLPPFTWHENRRARIRAELDAYYARLYGLTRKQLRYILDPADLTERELEDILDPWEEVGDALDPEGYAQRCQRSTFPGETFRVLKEKELRQFGEYRTRRLVLEAWERLGRG